MNNNYDNGFNNQPDYNNPYNQQMGYNQFNQQNGFNQQPMGYNQYPNQYDPNAGMYQQPVQNHNRGGGIIGIILAILLIGILVFFLLEYTGTTSVTGWFDKTEEKDSKKDTKEESKEETKEDTKKDDDTKEPEKEKESGGNSSSGGSGSESGSSTDVDYRTKAEQTCSKTNAMGDYNTMEEVAKRKLTEEQAQKIYTTGDVDDDTMWSMFKGEIICEGGVCIACENNDTHLCHAVNCADKDYKKVKWYNQSFNLVE